MRGRPITWIGGSTPRSTMPPGRWSALAMAPKSFAPSGRPPGAPAWRGVPTRRTQPLFHGGSAASTPDGQDGRRECVRRPAPGPARRGPFPTSEDGLATRGWEALGGPGTATPRRTALFLDPSRKRALTASAGVRIHGSSTAALLVSALRVSTLPSFALEDIARQGLPGVSSSSLVWRCGVGLDVSGWLLPSALFDNHIGRKRNVDGGVLAVRLRPGIALRCGERTVPTVTFPNSSRSASGLRVGSGRMCLGLVETFGLWFAPGSSENCD